MKRKLFLISLMLLISAFFLASCDSDSTPTDKTTPPIETATGDETEAPLVEIPEGVITARESAMSYVLSNYNVQVFPAPGSNWEAERTTPENLVGSESYEFYAGDINIAITYPIVTPQNVIYHVVIGKGADFQWEGDVDAAGQVTE